VAAFFKEMVMADKTVKKRGPGRPFQPGQSGNPGGCPAGSRHKVTKAVQELFDGEAEALTRKCIELAMDGDMTALRMALDRICPTPKDRPVRVTLPALTSPSDLPLATEAVLSAVADGALTPSEAAGVAALLEVHRKALETLELEKRIAALEAAKGA
jgi:hypothetical protein